MSYKNLITILQPLIHYAGKGRQRMLRKIPEIPVVEFPMKRLDSVPFDKCFQPISGRMNVLVIKIRVIRKEVF